MGRYTNHISDKKLVTRTHPIKNFDKFNNKKDITQFKNGQRI